MITYIFRRPIPTFFSIEKLFDALYAHFDAAGLGVVRLELPHVSTGLIAVLRNVWFVARRRNTTLLHITGDVHYAALLCPFAKTVITVHDCVVLQRGTGLKRLAMRWLWFDLPLRRASAVVVISEQTKRELLATMNLPEHRIRVIPNFVDPLLRCSERPFAANRPRILHVGTTTNKNLDRVIDALAGIDCCLVVVGRLDPGLRRRLEASGVAHENVVGVDHAAMRGLYREADLVSFPSTYEGFGMPILEGQAAGRPVLTSGREPMRSVAGPGGALLVDPESVESIRSGFEALIGDADLRARLVAAGLANCARYSLESVAAQYADLYSTLWPLKAAAPA